MLFHVLICQTLVSLLLHTDLMFFCHFFCLFMFKSCFMYIMIFSLYFLCTLLHFAFLHTNFSTSTCVKNFIAICKLLLLFFWHFHPKNRWMETDLKFFNIPPTLHMNMCLLSFLLPAIIPYCACSVEYDHAAASSCVGSALYQWGNEPGAMQLILTRH